MSATVVMGILGLVNAYILFVLAGNRDWKKETDRRINELESCKMSEERFRAIIKDELNNFELRLINSGQVPPREQKG